MKKQITVYIIFLTLGLSACAILPGGSYSKPVYICPNAEKYANWVVGNGECVDLIRACSTAPRTSFWKKGDKVKGKNLPIGTIIANFKWGKYPNKSGYHAAIYAGQNRDGIWVWDQWRGKAVHKRLIRFKSGKGLQSNDGDKYYVVE